MVYGRLWLKISPWLLPFWGPCQCLIVVIAPCNTDQTWSRCYGRGNLTLLPGTSSTTTNRGYSPWSLCGHQPPRLRACSSRAPVASASGNDLLSSRTKGRDSQSIWYGSEMVYQDSRTRKAMVKPAGGCRVPHKEPKQMMGIAAPGRHGTGWSSSCSTCRRLKA
jgi:hypothetical protein